MDSKSASSAGDYEYQRAVARQELILQLNSVTEGDSLTKLLAETVEEKDQLTSSLREGVLEYFQNAKVCEALAEKCVSNVKVMQASLKDLDNSVGVFAWAKHPALEKLVRLRKNLSTVVDTLHDFLNVSSQMKNLREQMKDYRNYEHVQKKLLTICTLRDNMMGKSESNKKLEQTFRNFSEKFKEIRALEEEFYDLIFENIAESIDLAKNDPRKLARTLKVVETGDLTSKEKDLYFGRAKTALREMVSRRFKARLGEDGHEDIGSKLEAAKNSVDDMMDAHEYLVPIFPPKFDIFNFMRTENKKLVESLVMPFLTNMSGLKEDPGIIVYLISWLDNYEVLLRRVGIEGSEEYADLRQRIKELVPLFLSHVESTMKAWVGKMLKRNEDETRIDRVEAKLEAQEPLESNFPEDLFGLFNKQMALLGEKLKGEMFISVIRIWMNYLQDTLEEKADRLVQTVRLDGLLKYPLEINDFHKLALNLNDNKNEVSQYVQEDHMDKVNQLFTDTARVVSKSTDKLIESMVELMFTKIEESAIEQLFTSKWSEEGSNIAQVVIDNIQGNLNPLQEYLSNPVHNMRATRYCVERLVYLYLERFLWYIRLVYGRDKVLDKFEPSVYKTMVREMKQRTPERERLEDRQKILKCLSRDYDTIEKYVKENDQAISSTSAADLLGKLELILNLMRLEACDFVMGCHQYRKLPYCKQAIEAVVWIRKDIDKGALKIITIKPNDDSEDDA